MRICYKNCMGCLKYETAQKRKTCPTYKLRAKHARHATYELIRKNKCKAEGKEYIYKPCRI